MNKVKKHLEDTGRKERIPAFQKGALELIKFIAAKVDDFQLYADCA